jgi:hypothetical protein
MALQDFEESSSEIVTLKMKQKPEIESVTLKRNKSLKLIAR